MRKALVLFSTVICFSLPAFSQAVGEACASATDTAGVCAGDAILFCPSAEDVAADTTGTLTADQWAEGINCGDLIEGEGIAGTCYADTEGPWCTFPAGEFCAFQDSAGDSIYFFCGATAPDASMYCSLDDGTCTAHGATCADDLLTCDGTTLVICAGPELGPFNRGFDCTTTGDTGVNGTGCSSGTCTGIVAGGPCDGDVFLCADGLTCNASQVCDDGSGGGGNGGGNGTTTTPDAGPDDSSSRDDETGDEEPAACSSTKGNQSLPLGLAFALFGLGLVRRRRS
jgi:hypothetical protein